MWKALDAAAAVPSAVISNRFAATDTLVNPWLDRYDATALVFAAVGAYDATNSLRVSTLPLAMRACSCGWSWSLSATEMRNGVVGVAVPMSVAPTSVSARVAVAVQVVGAAAAVETPASGTTMKPAKAVPTPMKRETLRMFLRSMPGFPRRKVRDKWPTVTRLPRRVTPQSES